MSWISAALFVLAVLGTAYYILSTLALDLHFRRIHPSPYPSPARGEGIAKVSILKPVRGVDASSEVNFLSFLNQDYEDQEVLFGVLDEDDPAVDLIKRLIKDKPKSKLSIGSDIEGFNNKVRILHNLSLNSSGEIIVITDADTRATPDFISRITAPLINRRVGMVTCMYRGMNGRTIADALEALHMACVFGPGVAAANALGGIRFGLGASIAIRREVLDRFGGFDSIRNYLADDFQLGRKTAMLGYDVVLSDYVIDITLAGEKFIDVLARELRWSVTTRVSRPWGHFGLIVTFGFAYAVFFCISTGFSGLGWMALAIVTCIRVISAYWESACLGDGGFMKRAWLLPIRDMLSFAIWVAGYFRRSVTWRGRKLTLSKNGTILGSK